MKIVGPIPQIVISRQIGGRSIILKNDGKEQLLAYVHPTVVIHKMSLHSSNYHGGLANYWTSPKLIFPPEQPPDQDKPPDIPPD